MPTDELLECFDDAGKVIAPQLRSVAHTKPYSIWHGVCNIWIVNTKGELLCSKRADFVSGNPGKWQTYFGGHVKAGSSFLDTAITELTEEVGLAASADDLKLLEAGKSLEYRHIFHNFVYLFEGALQSLKFQDGEVAEVKWYSLEQYQEAKLANPDAWCNGTRPEQYEAVQRVVQGQTKE